MLAPALLGAAVILAVVIPMPIPHSLAYPDSLLYPAATAVALVWLWLRDRAGLRVILASFLAFGPLHLALFTALPSFILEHPDAPLRCGFMSTGFVALDQHRSGPSEFFGLVALLWAALFGRHRSPAARVLGAAALVAVARAPVPIGFFAVHMALGAGLAAVALLLANAVERLRGRLLGFPVPLSVLVAGAFTWALMLSTGPRPVAPQLALLLVSVLAIAWTLAVSHIPDVKRRPTPVIQEWA